MKDRGCRPLRGYDLGYNGGEFHTHIEQGGVNVDKLCVESVACKARSVIIINIFLILKNSRSKKLIQVFHKILRKETKSNSFF